MDISSISGNYYSFYQNSVSQSYQTTSTNSTGASEEMMPPPPPPPQGSESGSSQFSSVDPSELMDLFRSSSDYMRYQLNQSDGEFSTGEVSSKEEVDAQINSLMETDISSLTDEEITETLTSLQSTLSTAPYLPQVAGGLVATDLDSLSISEQEDLLTDLQDEAVSLTENRGSMQKAGGPPPPPPPTGSGEMESTEDSEESTIADLMEQLLDRLSSDDEEYDYSSSELLATLQENMQSYLNEL